MDSTTSGVLDPLLLGLSDPEILLATRPAVFGVLSSTSMLERSATVRVQAVDSLAIHGRAARQRRAFLDAFGFRQDLAQAYLLYRIRSLELEAGAEWFELRSTLGRTFSRRVYVRIRRDFSIF
jgi:hypothetical protein